MDKLGYLKDAVFQSANLPEGLYEKVLDIEKSLKEFNRKLNGDDLRSRYEGASPTSVKGRVDLISGSLWITTAAPTTTFSKSYDVAAALTESLLLSLKNIDDQVKDVESIRWSNRVHHLLRADFLSGKNNPEVMGHLRICGDSLL